MDVRCPNCKTEYELDEGRLRPGGVTVKCASCEHVFRVRRRGDTAAGIGRNVLDLCVAAGEVILVTNPEPTSLTDAYGLLKNLRQKL